MPEVFSPERLRLARQRRAMLIQEVAARVKVSVRSVSNWENGKKTPNEDSVSALMAVLDFPREFFFAPAPPVLAGSVFRSAARTTARQRDKAIAAGIGAIELDQWISKRFIRPAPRLQDLRGATPEAAAESLRADWGLGYKPIPNMIHLLESNGIRVYSIVHDSQMVDAFSSWFEDVPYVFLNTMKTAERSRMDAAHELGHLALHPPGEPSSKTIEQEARLFASCFLMPRAPFIAQAPRVPTLSGIVDAKQSWGVSALAYIYRLHSLGMISDWHYKQLCIQLRTRFRNDEPGPRRAFEASQVLGKVTAELRSGGVGRRQIASSLYVNVFDIDEITFGLVLTPLVGRAPTGSLVSGIEGGPGLRLVK